MSYETCEILLGKNQSYLETLLDFVLKNNSALNNIAAVIYKIPNKNWNDEPIFHLSEKNKKLSLFKKPEHK